jgi:hypothetical protein
MRAMPEPVNLMFCLGNRRSQRAGGEDLVFPFVAAKP